MSDNAVEVRDIEWQPQMNPRVLISAHEQSRAHSTVRAVTASALKFLDRE